MLFALLIAFTAFYSLLNLFMPQKAMDVFKIRLYTISTGSMEPVLPVGSLVLVKKTDVSKLKVDDIITFYADVNLDGQKEVVTHYVADIRQENGQTVIRTKREAAVFFDSWHVSEDDVIGTYVAHVPYAGRFAQFMKSAAGLITILIDLTILIFANMLIDTYCQDGVCEIDISRIKAAKKKGTKQQI